jgi:sarcosine oxidase, subunit gamma
MSDMLMRHAPVPATPFAGKGVTISLAPSMARFSLRARRGQDLESLLGVKVPTMIGATAGGLACLGPDEWLMRAPLGAAVPFDTGQGIAVTDVSERSVCLCVEGPRAAQIIMAGCPQDIERFPIGKASRTIYESVEIILIREAEDRFHIEVWRSFAPWLWTSLTTAAAQCESIGDA